MSQSSLVVPSRRLFLRNSGTAVLSGAAVALLADREALAQSETMSQANLHDFAPTQFKEESDYLRSLGASEIIERRVLSANCL
jgi:hypothetical protein